MPEWWGSLVAPAFATLFVIIDPLGLTPMFAALTAEMSTKARRMVAIRSVALAFGVLLLFALFGEGVLKLMGISLPAFRIAGGLLLFVMAMEMLFEKRSERRRRNVEEATHEVAAVTEDADERAEDVWVFPLGIPLIAGPGAITSVILLMDAHAGHVWQQLVIILILIIVLAATLIMFLMVVRFGHLLSETATRAISRILGMILAALAVQFVITGFKTAGFMAG
ncbi:MarC family protein [Thermopetrobacter sp. TC1]|uniref:MarC family protein n=1 Tax=Thermopetrobacter sp. TC1 TaxID=1495045 RepID=UPI000570FD49|nr:MarC family protein [Thermopetrobacter sp. TC1]